MCKTFWYITKAVVHDKSPAKQTCIVCLTLLPRKHDLFPCGKKKSFCVLTAGSCIKPANQIRDCQIEKVISSLVCCLGLAELLSTFEPKPYLQNPNLPILAVCHYCGLQPKANCLWLSTRFSLKYQIQTHALTTLEPKALIVRWHIVGTAFLTRSLSFIGLQSVSSFSLFPFPKSCIFCTHARIQSHRHLEKGKRRKKKLKKKNAFRTTSQIYPCGFPCVYFDFLVGRHI